VSRAESTSQPAARLHLSVIVPAWNEAGRLEAMVRDTLAYLRGRARPFEVVVVDDGSTDGTSDVVRRIEDDAPELRLIRLPRNRGKGHAVRTGVANARGALILFADADGATPIAELERLEIALADGAAVAIGSRALREAGIAVNARPLRRVIGRSFHALVRLLAVRGYRDTQCGFKLFRSDAAHDLFHRLHTERFAFDVEILVAARVRGHAVREVPVNWTHQPGSRINLVTDSFRMAVDLLRIRWRAARGVYDDDGVAESGRDSSTTERISSPH
jgi:dolichyl-phosphate beta-glucosyltransferase